MSQDDSDGNPHSPDDQTGGVEQPRRAELSMDQLQSMITGSLQAALPSLENAITEKVTQSLQAQGKLLCICLSKLKNYKARHAY